MEMEDKQKPSSSILKYLKSLFAHAIEMIDNDECSETDAISMINRFNAESRGYYDKTSLLNYDEAMRLLDIKSRNKFKDICRLNRIEQVKLNNMNVGFKRTEIEDLALRLQKKVSGGR